MSEETKELLIDLQQYIDEPNNQDINGEYEPTRELEQGEARLLLVLIINLQNQLQQKENIIKEVREYIKEMQVYCIEFESWGVPSKELLEILDKENK